MGSTNAYGKRFGENFGVEEAPSIITKVLRKAEVAVTEIRSDNPRVGLTAAIPREDAYLVGLQLRDYPDHVLYEDGRQTEHCHLKAGDSVFFSLECDPVALIDKPFHSIHFYIPRSALNAIADDANAPRVRDLNYRPGQGVSDATIMCLGNSLLGALEQPERASKLFVDHVTLAVATHVAQFYGGLRPASRPARGGLAPWQARRAKEILSANLDGSVTLNEIASECGLSVSHFARAFRVSIGMAPHQWLLHRRLEYAKTLLPNEQMSLSDVALASGFADQSHFTRVFSKEIGTSPGAWRRCLKG